MEVEMTIRGLLMDPVTNTPIVILKDVAGDSVLPIWVGVYEANAIALEMEKVNTPRPMTHDLIKECAHWAGDAGAQGGGDGAARRYILCGDLGWSVEARSSVLTRVRRMHWRWRCAWIVRSSWMRLC